MLLLQKNMPGTQKNTLHQNTGEEVRNPPKDADKIVSSFKQAEKYIKIDLEPDP